MHRHSLSLLLLPLHSYPRIRRPAHAARCGLVARGGAPARRGHVPSSVPSHLPPRWRSARARSTRPFAKCHSYYYRCYYSWLVLCTGLWPNEESRSRSSSGIHRRGEEADTAARVRCTVRALATTFSRAFDSAGGTERETMR